MTKHAFSALKRFPLVHPAKTSAIAFSTFEPKSPIPNKPYFEIIGPFAPLGVPVWNPFLNLRGMSFSVRMRPVPVVFLRLAFRPQLSVG